MPSPGDQNFFGMFAGAGGIGVESLDHQIKGRGSDDIEISIDASSAPHFVRRSVKISETDIVRHANAPSSRSSLRTGNL